MRLTLRKSTPGRFVVSLFWHDRTAPDRGRRVASKGNYTLLLRVFRPDIRTIRAWI